MKYVSDFSGPYKLGVLPGGLMNASDDTKLRQKLAQLRQEHRDLDDAIIALETAPDRDQLRLNSYEKA